MKETNRMKLIMMKWSETYPLGRIYRNNTGMAYQGKPVKGGLLQKVQQILRSKSVMILDHARPIQFGLYIGSSDLIGWRPVVITQEMVGRTIAQFSAIEVKADDGVVSDDQERFINMVNKCGGFGIVVSDSDLNL